MKQNFSSICLQSYALLQGIFLSQGSNPCLLHCRADSLLLSYWEALKMNNWS